MLFYIVILHSLLLGALLSMTGGLLQQAVALSGVVCLFVYSRWRYTTDKSDHWVNQMTFHERRWYLSTRNGEHPVSLQQATVWQWLLVMNFCHEQTGRCYQVQLLPDSCAGVPFRRLRAVVRHFPVW